MRSGWFLFLYFKYLYFRSLKRFWDCNFNFVNVLKLPSFHGRTIKDTIKRVLIWRFTLVLIKINYGQIGDQKDSFIKQTQIIMGLRIFYPRYIKSSRRQWSVDVEFRRQPASNESPDQSQTCQFCGFNCFRSFTQWILSGYKFYTLHRLTNQILIFTYNTRNHIYMVYQWKLWNHSEFYLAWQQIVLMHNMCMYYRHCVCIFTHWII